VRVQGVREGAQDAGLADAGLAGQQSEPWAMQEPLEALAQRRMRAVVPEFGAVFAEQGVFEAEVFEVHG